MALVSGFYRNIVRMCKHSLGHQACKLHCTLGLRKQLKPHGACNAQHLLTRTTLQKVPVPAGKRYLLTPFRSPSQSRGPRPSLSWRPPRKDASTGRNITKASKTRRGLLTLLSPCCPVAVPLLGVRPVLRLRNEVLPGLGNYIIKPQARVSRRVLTAPPRHL